jgi:hypothetical protein
MMKGLYRIQTERTKGDYDLILKEIRFNGI